MKIIKKLGYPLLATNLLLIIVSFTDQPSAGTGSLTVIVKNIRDNKGQIGISLYQSGDGPAQTITISLTYL